MSKKRKRDLNERIKAKEEASVSGNDSLFDSLVYLSIEKCTTHPVEKCTSYFSNNFLVSLIL